MKGWETYRFEICRQLKSPSTWIFYAAFLGLSTVLTYVIFTENDYDQILLNAPINIALISSIISLLSVLLVSKVAGNAAAHDVRVRMDPLIYTSSVHKLTWLSGRFFGAFTVIVLLLTVIPVGLMVGIHTTGLDAELLGPFRFSAYAGPFLHIVVINAFAATAILFTMALITRREISGYLGAIVLLFLSLGQELLVVIGWRELGNILDPFGMAILFELEVVWTIMQKNSSLISLEGALFTNRLLWLFIGLTALVTAGTRFRFRHPVSTGRFNRFWQRLPFSRSGDTDHPLKAGTPMTVPHVRSAFTVSARLYQAAVIAGDSFRQILNSKIFLLLLVITGLMIINGPELLEYLGIPYRPTTLQVIGVFGYDFNLLPLIAMPAFLILYAGELVWAERDAGLNEIHDAAPVPDSIRFLGKYMGLVLLAVLVQVILTVAGMLLQEFMGHPQIETGLYLQIFTGIQLFHYLLIAAAAMIIHVLVDHKFVGNLAAVLFYVITLYPSLFGLEHHLLIFGSDPGWSYTDMSGYGPDLLPWTWFMLYWAGWTVFFITVAMACWKRGVESGGRLRISLVGRRLTSTHDWTAAGAAGIVLISGGYIFYNTNILNEYYTSHGAQERRVSYERLYGRFEGISQPQITRTRLHVEIYPDSGSAELRGTYHLENRHNSAIDSIHLGLASEVETGSVAFDRRSRLELEDNDLGHRLYVLEEPLLPGDSLELSFEVQFDPEGFANSGINRAVVKNGTYIKAQEWLPAIGYQRDRELINPADRRKFQLPEREIYPSPYDSAARQNVRGRERVQLETVIGTAANQVAVAPGSLIREWEEGGRRYFHYTTDAPIANSYPFFSADYEIREAQWNDVRILIYYHPGHPWNVDRYVEGIKASLEYFTAEFGPYPHSQVKFVESPRTGVGATAYPATITYSETFSVLHPEQDPRNIDFPFGVVAHEMAHQWWGNQVAPARAEGAALLSESLAWYSAMGVIEQAYGPAHLRRILDLMRQSYLVPRSPADVPLLRATNHFQAYRKGPFAMYALREYIGEKRVNGALRRFFSEFGSGEPPLPTSADLYRELRSAAPDSMHYLLSDLFETNTYWELATEEVSADSVAADEWQVTIRVSARKFSVDRTGTVSDLPLEDWVEIGVFGAPEGTGGSEEVLYLQKHLIDSEEQTITLTVPRWSVRIGIDPHHLLIDVEIADNVMSLNE